MWTPPGLDYVRRLGQGGGARVHLLEVPETGECVSLKLADASADPSLRDAVLREVSILERIEYPGLPHVLDSGGDEAKSWYTYRHVDGRPLRSHGAAPDRLSFDAVARGLLGALFVLHDLGWVHYDVSPDNILVTEPSDWTAVSLIDLGHAGRPGRTLLGTPGYMAPEILRGEPGGAASDLFSAGLTLIEYALGERLFAGRTQREMTDSLNIVREGIHDRLSAAVGEDRARLLMSMTEADPARRPADAWSALLRLGEVPDALVYAALTAVLNSGLDIQGDGEQARADLASGLKGLRWEAGSASAIADRVSPEIANPRFELPRFLSWLVETGSVQRSSGAWLLTKYEEDSLARGFDREVAREQLNGLAETSRMALLLLAAAAEYRDRAAGEWVARVLVPELGGVDRRLVVKSHRQPPAYAALLRDVADPDELTEARLRAAALMNDESLRAARVFLRLRAGEVGDRGVSALLVQIARQGRLREASQIADAIEALPTATEDLLVAAAWARTESRDFSGSRRLIDRVTRNDTAVRLLDAVAEIELEGTVSHRRGEIEPTANGEAAIARLAIDLATDESVSIETACDTLRTISPFEMPGSGASPAEVLTSLAPLVTPPSAIVAHGVMSVANTMGRRLYAADDVAGAREVFEAARNLAEAAGMAARASAFEGNYANCLIREGRQGKAADILESLAHRREAMGDTVGAITVWGNLGVIRFNEGEADAALVSWERQAALVREIGQSRKLGAVTCRIACALQEIGSWGSAREAFESAIRLAEVAEDTATEMLSRLNLTGLLVAEGDTARAMAEWRSLSDATECATLSEDQIAQMTYLRARIDVEFGRPVLGRAETLKIIESEGQDCPANFESLEIDERLEIAIRNATVLGENRDFRPRIGDPERPSILSLVALACGLRTLESDAELLDFAGQLPDGIITTEVAENTTVFLEILIRFETERGRSPGQLVQQAHELAHRTGLPGLLWRSHLAMGLKDLRRGSLKESALAFGTALRGFRKCHAPGAPTLPASLKQRADFRALGHGIRRLAEQIGGRLPENGDDTISSLTETLATCAIELAGRGEGGGKWERGIEKVLSVTEKLNSTGKLDPLLVHVVESVLDLCDAEYGFMVLLDEAGAPSIRVAQGGFNGKGEAAENQVSNTLIRRVLSRRESLLIQNALDEKDLVDKPSVQMLSLQSIMCAPLIYKDQLLGAILVDNRTAAGCFTRDDLRLLEVFASQASIAIQNTRLYEDLEESYRSLEEAQDRLLRSEKLKSLGVLAGGIAHDFNNLLMSVLGNADLALMYLPKTSPATTRVTEIKSAALLAGDLCNQLLAYSGKGQFVVSALDISEAVRGVSEMLAVSVSKKVRLSYDLTEGLPGIEADATQIRQVILNLITNAAEACGEAEGVVSIETGTRHLEAEEIASVEYLEAVPGGDYVFLEVRDTGCGMDEETKARLFEPFFTTKFTGRGLGLSAVMGIVRGHEGTIRLETHPGRGTTITILLPAREGPVAAKAPEQATDETWKATGTVLLVDDEAMVRDVARAMLHELGVDVVTAEDGVEAVDIFRERADQIDLVILDMNMPRMSGDEAFREIRRIREDARIVISSGYSEADTIRSFADDVPAGFMEKPYEFAVLREKLHSLLA